MRSRLNLALLETLRSDWADYRRAFRSCRTKWQIESVHDLRTSIRRLRADLKLVERLGRSDKLKRELKSELHSVRKLRDLQVQLSDRLSDRRLECYLRTNMKREIKRARSFFGEISWKRQNGRMSSVQAGLLNTSLNKKRIVEKMRKRLERFQKSARKAQRRFDDPLALHRARIALKRYRYTREALRGRARVLKKLQELLGKVQDATVWLKTLDDYVQAYPKRGEEVKPLVRRWKRQREDYCRQFAQCTI
jgi:CHAD domain-containing protein